MGGESAHGLRNLINSIRVSSSRVYLISSRPFTSEGKRKTGYMKECLDPVVDLLNGIYLLDMEEVIQYAVATRRGQTLLDFFQFCDGIILDFINIFVSELEKIDRRGIDIFDYNYLESEMTVQNVLSIREYLLEKQYL
jgi:hypothetical protein